MQKYNFGTEQKRIEKEYDLGGSKYKFKEGANKFRIMTAPLPLVGTYKGNRSVKMVCYIIDRVDGKVKPAFLPYSVYKQISAIATSEDFFCDTIPMAYDITVNAVGAGQVTVEYTTMPGRTTPVTEKEQEEVVAKMNKKNIQQFVDELQSKNDSEKSLDEVQPPHEEEEVGVDEPEE
jgi:hypothetical protein